MTTYYHLADMQNGGDLMEIGRNSESLEEIAEAILSYISIDYPSENDGSQEWEDWQSIQKMGAEELAEWWEFSINTTTNKI